MDTGNSLAVQWLLLHAFTAEGPGSIPGWGAKIPQAVRRGREKNNNKWMQRTDEREAVIQDLSKEASGETGDGRWRS